MNRQNLLCTALLLVWCGCARAEKISERIAEPGAVSGEPLVAAEGDSPWWRGPNHDGKYPGQNVATEWGPEKNVQWRTKVPGRGHSTPIVCGSNIFLTTADEEAHEQLLLCYDRATGNEKWKQTIHTGGFMHMHRKNSHASATPACDGELVFTTFMNDHAIVVTAMDLEGNQVWQERAGPFTSEHGFGQSPMLYKSILIVNGDNLENSFIAALDRKTGDGVWRISRKTPTPHGSFATPVVAHVAGRDQLLIHGYNTFDSFDPATGKRLWFCKGPCEVAAGNVAFNDEMVFASGGWPEKSMIALKADGSGDMTDSIEWSIKKGITYVPSPLYHEGVLYLVNDGGIASCLDAKTGNVKWTKRLNGSFSSSPVLAGGHIYATNEKGVTYVFNASPDSYQQIAENDLGSGGFASPVMCSGKIYMRTRNELLCIE